MFSFIVSVIIIGGLIAFSTYQAIQLVKAIRERKNAKSNKKEKIE